MLNNINIKTINNKKLRIDLFVIIYVLVLPFIFYFYTIAPEDSSEWRLKWFTINPGHFREVDYYVWILFVKFLTLNILSIWFITCVHKWKSAILFAILFEIHKIIVNINYVEYGNLNVDLLISLLVSIPYMLFLYLISYKLYSASNKNNFNRLINNEINMQLESVSKFNSKDCKLMVKKFLKLKDQKSRMNRKEYLAELIALRDQIAI